jgi:hypothetical protein
MVQYLVNNLLVHIGKSNPRHNYNVQSASLKDETVLDVVILLRYLKHLQSMYGPYSNTVRLSGHQFILAISIF